MELVLYLFAKTVSIILEVVSIAMMVRMILSFFISSPENKLYMLSCFITEPFIIPVRILLERLNIGQDTPIDMAFFFTSIIIWLLQVFLPII